MFYTSEQPSEQGREGEIENRREQAGIDTTSGKSAGSRTALGLLSVTAGHGD